MKRVVRVLLVLIVAFACLLVGPTVWVKARAHGHLYSAGGVPEAPVAIVLGAGLTSTGRPTPFLRARLDLAAQLYDDGAVRALLVSGDNRTHGYDEPTAMRESFAFRQGRSRETAFSRDYDELYELLRHERDHGKVVWVMGPAFAFDHDARNAFSRLIAGGFVHAVLAGNALATHDLEAAYLNTALGQNIYTQESQPNGHYNHLDTINRINTCGSIERFIGILIEHFAGKFPVWLAPVQVKVIPVSEKSMEYATGVYEKLRAAGIRTELDHKDEKVGYKIRQAQLEKEVESIVRSSNENVR